MPPHPHPPHQCTTGLRTTPALREWRVFVVRGEGIRERRKREGVAWMHSVYWPHIVRLESTRGISNTRFGNTTQISHQTPDRGRGGKSVIRISKAGESTFHPRLIFSSVFFRSPQKGCQLNVRDRPINTTMNWDLASATNSLSVPRLLFALPTSASIKCPG